jgi:hypothetical protein
MRRFIVLLGLAGACPLSFAEEAATGNVFDAAALYAGQGADHNLRELPGRILEGNPSWEKSYMNALGLRGGHRALGGSWETLRDTMLADIVQGYELVLAKHHGKQDNAELGGAYTLKTSDLWLGDMGVNFSSGIGLSYALGTPSYEDGSAADPQKRYRLQLLLLFDLEWKARGVEHWSLVTRIHHRSGVYGLIAPPHVGSNFLAAGIRYSY